MILAIDFGTSRTRAAVKLAPNAAPIPVTLGESFDVPTAAFVEPGGRILVGESAWNKRRSSESHRYFAGRTFKLALGEPPREIPGEDVGWVELVEAVLRFALSKAESQFDAAGKFKSLILTVPAVYEEGAQAWQVMEEAGRRLGLELAPLVREPNAAAAWYAKLLRDCGKEIKPGEIVLVYDLGGGTFDAALLRATANGYEPLQSSGILDCGGTLFDHLLREDFESRFPEAYAATQPAPGESKADKIVRMQRSLALDEFLQRSVKHRLAEVEAVEGDEPVFEESRYKLARGEFDRMIGPALESTILCCEQLVEREGISWADLKRIVMVGASCRLPVVEEKLADMIARKGARDVELIGRRVGDAEVRPEVAVVLGAANTIAPNAAREGYVQVIPQMAEIGEILSVSEDGKWLLAETHRGLQIWCLETLMILHERVFPGVNSAWFAKDRRHVVVECSNGALVWDPSAGVVSKADAGWKESIEARNELEESLSESWRSSEPPSDNLDDRELSPDRASMLAKTGEEKEVKLFRRIAGRWQSRSVARLPNGDKVTHYCFYSSDSKIFLANEDSLCWAIWDVEKTAFVETGRFELDSAEYSLEQLHSSEPLGYRLAVRLKSGSTLVSLVGITDGDQESVRLSPGIRFSGWSASLQPGPTGVDYQSSQFFDCFVSALNHPGAPALNNERPAALYRDIAISRRSGIAISSSKENVFLHRIQGQAEFGIGEDLGRTGFSSRALATISPWGPYAAIPCRDDAGRFWKLVGVGAGVNRKSLPYSSNHVTFSTNGRFVAYSEYDREGKIYYLTCECLDNFPKLDRICRIPMKPGKKIAGLLWNADSASVSAVLEFKYNKELSNFSLGDATARWSTECGSSADSLSASLCGKYLVLNIGFDIRVVSQTSGELVPTRRIPATGQQTLFSPSGEFLAQLTYPSGAVRVSHLFEEIDLTIHMFRDGFIAYDGSGNFDASPDLMRYVTIDAGDRLLTTAEELAPFHRPDIVESILRRLS